MSFNRLSRILYDRFHWNMFKTEVEITYLRMMQTNVSLTCDVGVLIYSDKTVNSIFEFTNINRMNILELYLNTRLKRENFYSMEFTRVPSYTCLSSLSGNARNQILAQEIINMEARFGMTQNLYCYKKPERSDNEDDCYITRVEEDEEDGKDENTELVEPLNQFVVPPPHGFKYVSEYV